MSVQEIIHTKNLSIESRRTSVQSNLTKYCLCLDQVTWFWPRKSEKSIVLVFWNQQKKNQKRKQQQQRHATRLQNNLVFIEDFITVEMDENEYLQPGMFGNGKISTRFVDTNINLFRFWSGIL